MKEYESSKLLTVRETARILNVHPNTLRRWGDKGVFTVWRISPRGDRRFSQDEVLNVIRSFQGERALQGTQSSSVF